jgi:hypothetical protein
MAVAMGSSSEDVEAKSSSLSLSTSASDSSSADELGVPTEPDDSLMAVRGTLVGPIS